MAFLQKNSDDKEEAWDACDKERRSFDRNQDFDANQIYEIPSRQWQIHFSPPKLSERESTWHLEYLCMTIQSNDEKKHISSLKISIREIYNSSK